MNNTRHYDSSARESTYIVYVVVDMSAVSADISTSNTQLPGDNRLTAVVISGGRSSVTEGHHCVAPDKGLFSLPYPNGQTVAERVIAKLVGPDDNLLLHVPLHYLPQDERVKWVQNARRSGFSTKEIYSVTHGSSALCSGKGELLNGFRWITDEQVDAWDNPIVLAQRGSDNAFMREIAYKAEEGLDVNPTLGEICDTAIINPNSASDALGNFHLFGFLCGDDGNDLMILLNGVDSSFVDDCIHSVVNDCGVPLYRVSGDCGSDQCVSKPFITRMWDALDNSDEWHRI